MAQVADSQPTGDCNRGGVDDPATDDSSAWLNFLTGVYLVVLPIWCVGTTVYIIYLRSRSNGVSPTGTRPESEEQTTESIAPVVIEDEANVDVAPEEIEYGINEDIDPDQRGVPDGDASLIEAVESMKEAKQWYDDARLDAEVIK